jgi:HAD superfamily hydrolase (TIGR01509 family)
VTAAAYLFDFNGVLVDDERVHFATMRDVVAPLGVTLDETTYVEKYLAGDDVSCFRAMLRDAGAPHDDATVRACVEKKLTLYMRAIENELVVFDGAFDLLRACAARGPVAIVSGALRVEIELILRRFVARESVTTIVAAEDVSRAKPDPAGYREALRRLNARGAESIAIEDSIGGIEAALGAGCTVVGVAHSLPVDRLKAAGAALVVERIGSLDVDRLEAARGAR